MIGARRTEDATHTEDMIAVNSICEQVAAADPANDTLASYILESGVPAALAGEIPPLDRYFVLKVSKGMQNLTVGKNDFAEFKKIIRDQNDELLKSVNPQIREGMSKMSEGVSQDFDINFSMEISQMVPLAPHYEKETALLHNSGRVTDRSQSCLNAIEFALTQACPGLTYDSVPHI